MAGRLAGKVAFVTGAARGQGRSHCIRMAEEGAKVIATDLCEQMNNVSYGLGTPEELAETAALVEAAGSECVALKADVRSREQLDEALGKGMAGFGRLDIVSANAGICPAGGVDSYVKDFQDSLDVDLLGVMNTCTVVIPKISDHGSIIVTGSTAAMMPNTVAGEGGGGSGYIYAKNGLLPYVEQMSLFLASRFIRVNGIHPTNVNTALLINDEMFKTFRPDLENPTQEDFEMAACVFNAMPIPYVEPVDISNLVVFLGSDESRYITGQHIRVDAGSLLRWPNGPGGMG